MTKIKKILLGVAVGCTIWGGWSLQRRLLPTDGQVASHVRSLCDEAKSDEWICHHPEGAFRQDLADTPDCITPDRSVDYGVGCENDSYDGYEWGQGITKGNLKRCLMAADTVNQLQDAHECASKNSWFTF